VAGPNDPRPPGDWSFTVIYDVCKSTEGLALNQDFSTSTKVFPIRAGDGDTLMGITALWTAVHYRIPLLVVVSNNNSFFNDELHQDRMARQRERPVANRWIGQRIADPEPDLGMLAKAQGGEGFGPIRRPDELPRALRAAIDCVDAGGVAVVDVRVEPGYAPVNSASIARGAKD